MPTAFSLSSLPIKSIILFNFLSEESGFSYGFGSSVSAVNVSTGVTEDEIEFRFSFCKNKDI